MQPSRTPVIFNEEISSDYCELFENVCNFNQFTAGNYRSGVYLSANHPPRKFYCFFCSLQKMTALCKIYPNIKDRGWWSIGIGSLGMGFLMNLHLSPYSPTLVENPSRAAVANAARLLGMGEFQFLQLAYREWFGKKWQKTLSMSNSGHSSSAKKSPIGRSNSLVKSCQLRLSCFYRF